MVIPRFIHQNMLWMYMDMHAYINVFEIKNKHHHYVKLTNQLPFKTVITKMD